MANDDFYIWLNFLDLSGLCRNKQQIGTYFAGHPRFFVIKGQHFGNGLNMKNNYAFTVNMVLAA